VRKRGLILINWQLNETKTTYRLHKVEQLNGPQNRTNSFSDGMKYLDSAVQRQTEFPRNCGKVFHVVGNILWRRQGGVSSLSVLHMLVFRRTNAGKYSWICIFLSQLLAARVLQKTNLFHFVLAADIKVCSLLAESVEVAFRRNVDCKKNSSRLGVRILK
jgi:hypothetical protein